MTDIVYSEIEKAWEIKRIMDSMTPVEKLLFEKLETIESMLIDLKSKVEGRL